ncbi:LOB domain-containing protein 7-like [Pistacia vera]|uniref:LOB domain-containing protein 7-like n=1 Tax=Pistacia vera TaxID=55513 RepID=UPI001262E456|nr:LOB domain-containing protein 7-like [Pistacia vera]
MTIKGGTKQACAACKYQRRKCVPDCPLARYFPADQPKMFLNAHRLFGLKNIGRILKKVDSAKKDEAMRTIIFESTIRAKYPVHGCWGIICKLQHHIQSAMDEVRLVKATVARCKECNQYQVSSSSSPSEISTVSIHNVVNLGQYNDLYAETSENLMNQNDLKIEEDPFYDDPEDFQITVPELQVPQDYDHNLPTFDITGFDHNERFININPSKEGSSGR